MVVDAPICYKAAFHFTTAETTGTFTWKISLDKSSYVLKRGKITGPTGTYNKIACVNGLKKVRAFASYINPATVTITLTRWLRK